MLDSEKRQVAVSRTHVHPDLLADILAALGRYIKTAETKGSGWVDYPASEALRREREEAWRFNLARRSFCPLRRFSLGLHVWRSGTHLRW